MARNSLAYGPCISVRSRPARVLILPMQYPCCQLPYVFLCVTQSLVRIPETLVCAAEFIMLPTPAEHTVAIDELRKVVLRHYPDLKDKAPFWKRKASVLKVKEGPAGCHTKLVLGILRSERGSRQTGSGCSAGTDKHG